MRLEDVIAALQKLLDEHGNIHVENGDGRLVEVTYDATADVVVVE